MVKNPVFNIDDNDFWVWWWFNVVIYLFLVYLRSNDEQRLQDEICLSPSLPGDEGATPQVAVEEEASSMEVSEPGSSETDKTCRVPGCGSYMREFNTTQYYNRHLR